MELLEVKDVLPYFGVTEETFRTWIKRKKLPENLILKIGNTIRVRKAVLDKYLNGEIA
jgi:excisionase family DNA binding protein